VDRIGTQPGRIVGIRIPASDGHHTLRDQFCANTKRPTVVRRLHIYAKEYSTSKNRENSQFLALLMIIFSGTGLKGV
jgi:hypothetical protein